MKLIDADKLLEWLKDKEQYYGTPGVADKMYCEGREDAYRYTMHAIHAGTFDPTPPVQPDTTKRMDRYFIVSVKDEGFHLKSDEGEEVHYILIDINGRMEGYSDDLKEIESIYGRVTRIPGEVIK